MKRKSKIKQERQDNLIIGVVLMGLALFLLGNYFLNNADDEHINGESEVEEMSKIAVFETNKGTIKIELNTEKAPITTKNFIQYVEDGFYDGLVFHRVIDNFMIQGGGFLPDGTQRATREPIVLESDNGLKNEIGTVAMARTNVPDSASSQFFINVNNNEFLNRGVRDEGYAVFGKVVEGMSVVNEIKTISTTNKFGQGDWPVEDIIITKAFMEW